jgi:hypothetical protein
MSWYESCAKRHAVASRTMSAGIICVGALGSLDATKLSFRIVIRPRKVTSDSRRSLL